MEMDAICGDCKRATEVVLDHGSGDTICSECGLVLQSHSIDESSEWRTFANDDNDNADPNRVGMAHDPFFDGFSVLKTDITNSKDTKSTNMLNTRTIYRATVAAANKSTHDLTDAYDRLAVISERLGITSNLIKDCARHIFKNVFYNDNVKSCRPRNLDAVLSACLLVACQQENYPRTVKEVCAAVKDCNVTKKEVMKAKHFITKQLNERGGDANAMAVAALGKTIRASDLIKRFFYNMDINDTKVINAAIETAKKCEDEVDVRRSPVSVAAAVVYVITQLTGGGAALKTIANATEVAEGTIKNTYRDLYPHLTKIVPTSFAAHTQINTLCTVP